MQKRFAILQAAAVIYAKGGCTREEAVMEAQLLFKEVSRHVRDKSGPEPSPAVAERNQRICELYGGGQGLKKTDIAERFGLSWAMVTKIVKEKGE